MAKGKIEFKSEGFRTLNTSPAMVAAVRAIAERAAEAAGDGFEVSVRVGRSRARATVTAATKAAQKAEAEDKVLTRALGGL